MLCTQVLNGMTGALKTLTFDAGSDYEVVVVSIDPRDTPRSPATRRGLRRSYGRPQTAAGWHFLTGAESSIAPLAEALGFGATPTTANIKQYAHGAAMVRRDGRGVVARYLLGLDFAPRDTPPGAGRGVEQPARLGDPGQGVLAAMLPLRPDRREVRGGDPSTPCASGSSRRSTGFPGVPVVSLRRSPPR
jgi:protein SCO1/2